MSALAPSAVLLLPVVLNESAVEPVAVFHVESFEVVEFPENPRKAFPLLKEQKAKGLPPRLKLVEAPMTPPPTIPVALRFPVTLWFPLKLLATFSWGTLAVSRFRVTLPLVPPPVRSVPATTPVIVP